MATLMASSLDCAMVTLMAKYSDLMTEMPTARMYLEKPKAMQSGLSTEMPKARHSDLKTDFQRAQPTGLRSATLRVRE